MRKYGGPNGYGYKPVPEGHRFTSFRHLLAHLASTNTPSSSATLEDACPSVMDQGPTGSCTGHASMSATSTAFAKAGSALPFVPSPRNAYALGRAIDRAPNPDGSLPALTDDGADPDQVMRGVSEWGTRAIEAPTSDGRYSDCETSNVNNEPYLEELELDASMRLVGMYTIDSTGAQFVPDVCTAIANGFPVCFAVFVDTAFENWDPKTGPIGAPNQNDPDGGGHYLYAIGYRTDPTTGKKIVRFRNSWGTSWGMSGDGEGNEDFVAGWSAAYVMAVRPSQPDAALRRAA